MIYQQVIKTDGKWQLNIFELNASGEKVWGANYLCQSQAELAAIAALMSINGQLLEAA